MSDEHREAAWAALPKRWDSIDYEIAHAGFNAGYDAANARAARKDEALRLAREAIHALLEAEADRPGVRPICTANEADLAACGETSCQYCGTVKRGWLEECPMRPALRKTEAALAAIDAALEAEG